MSTNLVAAQLIQQGTLPHYPVNRRVSHCSDAQKLFKSTREALGDAADDEKDTSPSIEPSAEGVDEGTEADPDEAVSQQNV